jgi:zinc protease
MRRFVLPAVALFALALNLTAVVAAPPPKQAFPDVDIPYQKFVLPNGLTLLVHEDHKAPIVAVNTYYHVGSKDEKPGRTGFAHLFEHLMFNGSEHYNDDYFRAMLPAGATKLNGTTWYDRTNYFQNVPPSALDLTLWMESDRMGHLVGVIDQARLDEQRGVVQNEKRQGENRPYGKVDDYVAQATYPAGHPYSWTTIGSMEDLNAASLEDVKGWFRTWYGAGNVTLTIAGDVDTADVKTRVEKYFGDIPGGPVLQRTQSWVAKMSGEKRAILQDRVPQTRLIKTWNVPGFSSREAAILDIAAGVLGGGKTSRLYKRLVYKDQTATSVRASLGAFELGGQFEVRADVKPGSDVAAVERAMDEEMARLLKEGPTAKEVELQKTSGYAGFVRAAERIDGFGGKSTILAEGQVYAGSADFYRQQLAWLRDATPGDIQQQMQRWLSDGVFVLTVQPVPEYKTTASNVDRSTLPVVGAAPSLKLPPMQHAALSNGLKVVLVERHETPIVQFRLLFSGGSAADSQARPGTTSLMMSMLQEGTKTRSSPQIAERLEELGAQFAAGAGGDTATVSLNTLTTKLPQSLELYADLLTNPAFPASELARLKQRAIAQIRQQKADSNGIVSRLMPSLVYGEQHPYAAASRATEADVAAQTPESLREHYVRWLRPDLGTLLVVGDTTLAQLLPQLEQRFATWKATAGAAPSLAVSAAPHPAQPRVFLVNRTGAEQSTIVAAESSITRADPDFIALRAANAVIGGGFLSRVNMNLREDKHWSYGVQSQLGEAKGPGLFAVTAPVQTDKTAESLQELRRELQEITTTRKPTDREIVEAKSGLTLTLPGNNETVGEVAGSYANILTYGLPETYWNDFVGKVVALTPAQFAAAAAKLIDVNGLTWIVVGDLEKIEAKVRALNLGEVTVLDADGHKLR